MFYNDNNVNSLMVIQYVGKGYTQESLMHPIIQLIRWHCHHFINKENETVDWLKFAQLIIANCSNTNKTHGDIAAEPEI